MTTQRIIWQISVQGEPIRAQMTEQELLVEEIDKVIKEGCFAPSMRAVLLELARTNRPLFEKMLKASPAVPDPQKEEPTMAPLIGVWLTAGPVSCVDCEGPLDVSRTHKASRVLACPGCDRGYYLSLNQRGQLIMQQQVRLGRGDGLTPKERRIGRQVGVSPREFLEARRSNPR